MKESFFVTILFGALCVNVRSFVYSDELPRFSDDIDSKSDLNGESEDFILNNGAAFIEDNERNPEIDDIDSKSYLNGDSDDVILNNDRNKEGNDKNSAIRNSYLTGGLTGYETNTNNAEKTEISNNSNSNLDGKTDINNKLHNEANKYIGGEISKQDNTYNDFSEDNNNKTNDAKIYSEEKPKENKDRQNKDLESSKDFTIENNNIINEAERYNNDKTKGSQNKKVDSSNRDHLLNAINEIPISDFVPEDYENILSSASYSTVNHYYCMSPTAEETHLIIYGTKAWTFPVQDVNLTLSYPTKKPPTESKSAEHIDYIITGFKVVLCVDGVESRGYITNSGVLQDRITLNFMSKGITSLLYKFWLYGVPRDSINVTETHNLFFLCS